MASAQFRLPDLGEGIAEGELVEWLVEPGETVSEDQPIAEVETDKALVEVPSPYDGSVAQLHVEAGETVPVGDVIVTFEVADEEAPAESADDAGERADVRPVSEGGESTAGDADARAEAGDKSTPEDDETAASDTEIESAEPGDAGAPPGHQATAETGQAEPSAGRVFAPPSVRRLARELGVDIGTVEGGGPGGRVSEGDVRAAAERGGDAAAESEGETSAGGDTTPGGEGSSPSGAEVTAATETAAAAAGADRAEARAEDGAAATPPEAPVEPAGRERTLAAPATRRVAREEGVDIDDVPAAETRDGEAFVTAEAVREYAAARRVARGAETGGGQAAARPAEAGSAQTATAQPPTERPAGAARSSPDAVPGERVPYRGVRRSIGEHMQRSKFTAPHITHHDRLDATELVAVREEFRGLAAERGAKLTYLPFVMKAVVEALKEHPYVNATLDEENEEIVLREEYHVGVAVATDAGLMVPVVRDVDRKGLLSIAREVSELAGKARERTVAPGEMRGGTFTVTNVGAIGGEYATPIVNYPEVAILALGAIRERPWVVDGEVRARPVLPLSLSADHRVVDGAVAAEFTNSVIERLSNPKLLLLE